MTEMTAPRDADADADAAPVEHDRDASFLEAARRAAAASLKKQNARAHARRERAAAKRAVIANSGIINSPVTTLGPIDESHAVHGAGGSTGVIAAAVPTASCVRSPARVSTPRAGEPPTRREVKTKRRATRPRPWCGAARARLRSSTAPTPSASRPYSSSPRWDTRARSRPSSAATPTDPFVRSTDRRIHPPKKSALRRRAANRDPAGPRRAGCTRPRGGTTPRGRFVSSSASVQVATTPVGYSSRTTTARGRGSCSGKASGAFWRRPCSARTPTSPTPFA